MSGGHWGQPESMCLLLPYGDESLMLPDFPVFSREVGNVGFLNVKSQFSMVVKKN